MSSHKAHSIAEKAWLLYPQLHSGIIATLKLLGSGQMHLFTQHLLHDIAARFAFSSRPLDDDALRYRNHVVEIFTPTHDETKRGSAHIRTGIAELLNGDWRDKREIQHRCLSGTCCADRSHGVRKLQAWLLKTITVLTHKQLNKTDWRNWHRSLHLLGFLSSVHNLCQVSIAALCSKTLQRLEPQNNLEIGVGAAVFPAPAPEDAGNKMELWRHEMAASARATAAFWKSERPEMDVYLFATCLSPQPLVMHDILRCTGSHRDVQQVFASLSVHNEGDM